MTNATSHPAPRSSFLPSLIVAVVAINLLVAALAFWNLYHSRERTIEQVRLTTANLAALTESNLAETTRRIDLALLSIVDRLEHRLAEGRLTDADLGQVLEIYRERLPEVDAFRASRADGVIKWGKGVDPALPATYADRAFFVAHRAAPGQRLIVTEPIHGRVSKKWVVAFTRSYRSPDGGFAGVVSAAVPIEHFTRVLGEIKLGPSGSAVIRHVDRSLAARYPPVNGPGGIIGEKTVSTAFADLLDSGTARAHFHVARAPDGFERTYAFQRISGMPYVLTVGMAPQDYLDPWYDEVRGALGLLFALLLVSIVGSVLAQRAWVQRLADAEALLESESRYRRYVETAPEGIFVADAGGCYTDVNRAGCELVGYARDELLRMSIRDLAPAGATDEHEDLFAAIRNSSGGDIEIKLRHKDGRDVEVSLRSAVLPDGRVMGFCSDIGARKHAEAELASYRAGLEDLVRQRTVDLNAAHAKLLDTQFAMDSVGIGIHWVDLDTWRFIYVNRAAAEMLGYSPEQMLELSVSDIDPNFPASSLLRMRRELEKGGVVQVESQQRKFDGHLVPVEITAYLHAGGGQARPKLIVFVTAIARRKEAERALMQAKEVAEAANLAKSAFLANMSHEIRTPMNAIIGMTHLLRRSPLTGQQVERLDKIEAAGKHLLEIIEAVLDLSKIEAGKLHLVEKDFAPAALVSGVAAMLQERAEAKGLRLRLDLGTLPKYLRGDEARLQQALVNYIANAIKFTAHGEVVLRVRVEEEADAGVLLRFEVEDSGIGIEPEAIPRLFSAFEQADNSTTRKYGGTGLGLAITRKLAEKMGGGVGVTSRLGEGSRFWFTARLHKSAEGEDRRGSLPGIDGAAGRLRATQSGRRILLAEDEPVNREIAQGLLADVGMQVDAADDGEIAVALATRNVYDLILMDMQMPKLDGLEATRQIRRHESGTRCRIVAMTANAFEADRDACLAAGMDDFLTKPVEPERLYATVLRWFES